MGVFCGLVMGLWHPFSFLPNTGNRHRPFLPFFLPRNLIFWDSVTPCRRPLGFDCARVFFFFCFMNQFYDLFPVSRNGPLLILRWFCPRCEAPRPCSNFPMNFSTRASTPLNFPFSFVSFFFPQSSFLRMSLLASMPSFCGIARRRLSYGGASGCLHHVSFFFWRNIVVAFTPETGTLSRPRSVKFEYTFSDGFLMSSGTRPRHLFLLWCTAVFFVAEEVPRR